MSPTITRDMLFVDRLRQLARKNVKVELSLKNDQGSGVYTAIVKGCGIDYIEVESISDTTTPVPTKDDPDAVVNHKYRVTTIVRFEDIEAYSTLDDITNA